MVDLTLFCFFLLWLSFDSFKPLFHRFACLLPGVCLILQKQKFKICFFVQNIRQSGKVLIDKANVTR
jgi:hypothetical protein